MAFDAPRKTLDDIRRELDAEFGEVAATRIASDGDAAERSVAEPDDVAHVRPDDVADVRPARRVSTDVPARRRKRNVAPVSFDDQDPVDTARHDAAVIASARLAMQPRRRGGYVAAGIIGCLVGQLILFGFLAVMRHRAVSAPSLEPPMERVGATPMVSSTPTQSAATTSSESETPSERSTSRVAVAPPAPAPPTESETASAVAPAPTVAPPAPAALPTPAAPPSSAAAVPETPAASSPPAARPRPPAAISIPPAAPPASIASPAPAVSDPKPEARRVVKRTPTPPPPPPPAVSSPSVSSVRPAAHALAPDSPNWASSQEEVRAALSQWLASSGRTDQSLVSDTVVFLGADGRTARTHVPMRLGSKVVIREQRWVRGPSGWALVDDREAWQGR